MARPRELCDRLAALSRQRIVLPQCLVERYTETEFTEFTEATRTTGGLSKHRQKPYNAYYPNN